MSMTMEEFVEAAAEYNRLGWAVQEQFESILKGEPAEDQNGNAIRMIVTFLQNVDLEGAEEFADELAEQCDIDGDLGW